MHKIIFSSIIVLSFSLVAKAQDNNYGVKGFNPKTFEVTDSMPVTYNGLKAGYEIKEESEKTVGKKGDFSRYKIKFYLTNTSSEAKIMYRNLSFGGHSGPITNNIALFKCLNATGARLTNKMAMMELQVCKLEADVEDKDCNTGKVTINKRLVDIGFWIRPGETVSKTYPIIVPLGEKPKVTITYYAEVANQTGTFITIDAQQQAAQSFARIKNFATNTYLNTQPGSLVCSNIENGWWSSDWEIITVQGTSNFQIKNRWKNNFISSGNGMLTDDANNKATMWAIVETNLPNVFYIKNIADNTRIYLENGALKVSNNFISNDATSKWIIEK